MMDTVPAASPAIATQNPLYQRTVPGSTDYIIIEIVTVPSCIKRTLCCQCIAIILILLIAILVTYFANDKSFENWQLVMYLTIMCITTIYICSCCIYHHCKKSDN